ncbi:MAG: acyl-CoA desaturase, partial [Gammaproteobacteria bacterium]
TTSMVTKEWIAVHRKHHAKCEGPEDPHSPQQVGIHRVLWGGVGLYRKEADCQETLEKYGTGAPNDWIERHLYTGKRDLGILLMLGIDALLFGLPAGIIIWGVQMVWIPFWAAGVINGIGHYFGYRNFETPDASRNIVPWGIIIGGEELHNNHHAYPSSPKFSFYWWEFDIAWLYIRILGALGLARVKKAPPLHLDLRAPQGIRNFRDLVVNHVQITAQYTRRVLIPVLREEMRRADRSCRDLYRRARAWLLFDESLLDEKARKALDDMLSCNQRLRTVYQFKRQLKALWKRSSTTQEAVRSAIQEWCRQAEATGIKALQDFARSLQGLALQGG